MDEDHLEVVGESSKYCSMGLEVDVAYGNRAVTQKAELSLNIELLQEEKAVAGHVHDAPS